MSGRKKEGWPKSTAGGIGTNSSSFRESKRRVETSLRKPKVLSKASHKWIVSSGFPPRAALQQFTRKGDTILITMAQIQLGLTLLYGNKLLMGKIIVTRLGAKNSK